MCPLQVQGELIGFSRLKVRVIMSSYNLALTVVCFKEENDEVKCFFFLTESAH